MVDAEQVFAHPEYPPLMELKLRQIGFADMLILNKVKLAGPEQVAKVKAWLDEHFRNLRIVETNHCDVPNEILLGVGRFDPTRSRAHDHEHEHEHECTDSNCRDHDHGHNHAQVFSTWSYVTDLHEEAQFGHDSLILFHHFAPSSFRRNISAQHAAGEFGLSPGPQPREFFRRPTAFACIGRRTHPVVAQ